MVAIPRKNFVMIDRHSSVEVMICVVHSWEVAEKSSGTAYKKTRLRGSRQAPHFAQLGRSRQKFHERFRPLTCACLPNLASCDLPELFPND